MTENFTGGLDFFKISSIFANSYALQFGNYLLDEIQRIADDQPDPRKTEDARCKCSCLDDFIETFVNQIDFEGFIRSGTETVNGNFKSLMLEHKDAMMKKEAEWLTKLENEKIELGKQISIRDQMVLEARAETNEYKSMNQSILSQISDKEAKIAQVSFHSLGLGMSPSSEFERQTKK